MTDLRPLLTGSVAYGTRLSLVVAIAGVLGLLSMPRATAAAAARPTCTIVDLELVETDVTTERFWLVDCSNPTGVVESARYETVDDTAVGPADYIPFAGELPVPVGRTVHTFALYVIGDDWGEPTEQLAIEFEDPEGVVQFVDRQGTTEKTASRITIVDDDEGGGFTVTSVSRSAPEGDVGESIAEVEVTLSDPLDSPFDVTLETQDGSAMADWDYQEDSVTLTFQPGEVSLLVPITIFGDTDDEPDETVVLKLGTEEPAALDSGTLTILDDDDVGGGGPCIVVTDTALAVTGPASTVTDPSAARTEKSSLRSCGDVDVNVHVRGADAAGAGASWRLVDPKGGSGNPCTEGANVFFASLSLLTTVGQRLSETPLGPVEATIAGANGVTPLVLPAAGSPDDAELPFFLEVELPCEGSSGLGRPMSMDVVLTAVEP